MNKKLMLVLATAIFLACNFLFPQNPASPPEEIIAPPTEPALQPSDPQDLAPNGFTIVRLHPGDDDLPGKVVDGGAWGEDISENIAPVMPVIDEFFHGK